jgi:DNA-binding LacI/PurR family transcriptional regulator
MTGPVGRAPKYRQAYASLRRDIESGRLKKGDRVPSEAALVRHFGASRITVGRAVRDLQRAGLVERRAGSGTYVSAPDVARGLSFGVLVPDMRDTEIFESILQGMTTSPLAREHVLLLGSPSDGTSRGEQALRLCRQYIDRRVSGVFFAPIEREAGGADVNHQIVDAFDRAKVPVVLLDRTVEAYPGRGHHDLVGIDNRRAGYIITERLLRLGTRRIAFLAAPRAAATVDAREAGYREALHAAGAAFDRPLSLRLDASDAAALRTILTSQPPDAVVCANDRTAAQLMQTALRLGLAIPRQLRIVGIDDAEYASLLPVPLTTLRQPTIELGHAALSAMLERIARPDLPPRDILLHCELVIRESCGAA